MIFGSNVWCTTTWNTYNTFHHNEKTQHIQSYLVRNTGNISVAYLTYFFSEISLSEAEKEEIIEFEMDCVASMLRAKSSNGTG